MEKKKDLLDDTLDLALKVLSQKVEDTIAQEQIQEALFLVKEAIELKQKNDILLRVAYGMHSTFLSLEQEREFPNEIPF